MEHLFPSINLLNDGMSDHQVNVWSAVDFAHLCLERLLPRSGRVVDATAGNGFDSLFILDLLDENGELLALDIQSAAIEVTKTRLSTHSRRMQAQVMQADHADMRDILRNKGWNEIHGAVMNCGYLPGAEKSIRTDAGSTEAALNVVLELMAQGGVVVVVCYVGHPGGHDERDTVRACIAALPKSGFLSASYRNEGRDDAPECYIVQRR